MSERQPSIYLDYNATSPLLPEVADAVPRWLEIYGNPSSVHHLGRRARSLMEGARESVAKLANANAQDIVFTSGGTEANALALRSLKALARGGPIIGSSIEHPSVLAHADGNNLIPVDVNGQIDLEALEKILKAVGGPAVVATMLANNETGVVQPIEKVREIARHYGAFVHCDAIQGPGRLPIDIVSLDVDCLSLSAHKIGGLKGAGALVLQSGLHLGADMIGGGQERRRRGGTENVIGIAAFGIAASHTQDNSAEISRIAQLRDELESEIIKNVSGAEIFGQNVERLCNTICVSIPDVTSETQLMRLDLDGIAVSAGSACSSGKVEPSHVLLAMGVSPQKAKCAIRISLGRATAEADVKRFLESWLPMAMNSAA